MLPGAREIHGDTMSLPGFNGLPAMGCTQLGEDTINCPAENIIHKKATERGERPCGSRCRHCSKAGTSSDRALYNAQRWCHHAGPH